jgi:hypothetical protein
MSTNKFASMLLVGGSLAGVLTMALHPTGRDVLQNARAGDTNLLAISIHTLALFAEPLLLSGVILLIPALGRQRELVVTGVVFFAFATVAGVVAAAASGFIAPATVADLANADATKQALLLNVFQYTHTVNATFARLYAMFAACAILLWSVAILIGKELSRGLGAFGVVYGVAILLGVASQQLKMDIHGFGAVVLGQSIWFVIEAIETRCR